VAGGESDPDMILRAVFDSELATDKRVTSTKNKTMTRILLINPLLQISSLKIAVTVRIRYRLGQ